MLEGRPKSFSSNEGDADLISNRDLSWEIKENPKKLFDKNEINSISPEDFPSQILDIVSRYQKEDAILEEETSAPNQHIQRMISFIEENKELIGDKRDDIEGFLIEIEKIEQNDKGEKILKLSMKEKIRNIFNIFNEKLKENEDKNKKLEEIIHKIEGYLFTGDDIVQVTDEFHLNFNFNGAKDIKINIKLISKLKDFKDEYVKTLKIKIEEALKDFPQDIINKDSLKINYWIHRYSYYQEQDENKINDSTKMIGYGYANMVSGGEPNINK